METSVGVYAELKQDAAYVIDGASKTKTNEVYVLIGSIRITRISREPYFVLKDDANKSCHLRKLCL